MRSRSLLAAVLTALAVGLSASSAPAQWAPQGSGYGMAANDQLHPAITPDGLGGAFIAWSDSRPGPYDFDVYLQHVNAVGIPQWTANGVGVCIATGDQLLPEVVIDGAGGAIVAWEDFRNGNADIYAQRIDANGVPQWAAGGVALCVQLDTQTGLQLVADGAGGAIAVWEDFRGLATDLYGQRVNAAGNVRWTVDGRALISADEDQFSPRVIPAANQGAILTWHDGRNFDFDIFAQRVDSLGAGLWTANGVPVCTEPGTKLNPAIASDGNGGAVIAWEDFRDLNLSFDIYVQRVAANGNRLWTTNGVQAVAEDSDQLGPTICSDGSGGAIVAWQDNRAALPDIYARRIDAAGVAQWTPDGVVVSSANGTQQLARIVSDGAAGAIVVWEDLRTSLFNTDIYAQRLDPAGAPLWAAQGVALTAAGTDQVAAVVTTDGAGGAIVAWEDGRAGTSSDIYAQRVNAAGVVAPTVDVPGPRQGGFQLAGIHPNPCRTGTSIRLALPVEQAVTAEIFDLNGRRVRALASARVLGAGVHALAWDARDQDGAAVAGGLYWLRITTASGVATGKVTVLR